MNPYNKYKRTIFSWSIYDFANQPFTTITITFIYSIFFASTIFQGTEEAGVAAWGTAITISSVIVAFLSPIMGAIADRGGFRKILTNEDLNNFKNPHLNYVHGHIKDCCPSVFSLFGMDDENVKLYQAK